MGQYNPHNPYIMGQEWVPIRDASQASDQDTERGYTFRISHDAPAVSGAVWVKTPTPNATPYIAEVINVYPTGIEDQTGPIRKCVIPCEALNVTGSTGFIEGTAADVADPSDGKALFISGGSALAGANFAVQNFTQELFGKRILNVRLVYTQARDVAFPPFDEFDIINIGIGMVTDLENRRTIFQNYAEGPVVPALSNITPLAKVPHLSYVDLGNSNIYITNPMELESTSEFDLSSLALPWRYQELLLFSTTTTISQRRSVFIQAIDVERVYFGYLALEVFYCEETRVRYGGRVSSDVTPNSAYPEGPNMIALRDTNFNLPSALPLGEYLVTTTHQEFKVGGVMSAGSVGPQLSTIRQLYELPSHRGFTVDARIIEGRQFTSERTDEITTITLHTPTAIVTGSHAYGSSVGAPIYNTKTSVQEIINLAPTSVTVEQVRFYVRRFGDTLAPLLFSAVGGSFAVYLTVDEVDALPEIVDGWREVTLTLPSGSTHASGATSSWQWSSLGEPAGNQWQVLAASSPANLRDSIPAVAATGPATYQVPSGSTIELNWKSPPTSGTADDSTTDAVLLFSTTPPSVTGFAASIQSQSLTTALQCNSLPACVPSALSYVSLTWAYLPLCDVFDRTVSNTWNTPNVGPPWTIVSGAASSFNVLDGEGRITHSAAGTGPRIQAVAVNLADFDVLIDDITWPVLPRATITGTGNPVHQFRGRYVDDNNYVEAQLFRSDSNSVLMRLVQRAAGVETSAVGAFTPIPYALATSHISARFRAVGTTLQFRAWITGQFEPTVWILSMTTTVTAAGAFRLIEEVGPNSTNVYPLTSTYGGFKIGNPALFGNHFEIQRSDTVDTTWQTIMLSAGPCVGSFRDYEARVGVLSQYRLRTLNALDFAGPWVTGSATVPSPGVTLTGDGNSVLILTSNEQPTANLAYVMQFDNQPVEMFMFPETDTVQLQRLFGKDFFTAFHPLERGGEQFTRTLLINAAAISLPSLANFRSLRDLGWASLNYVCVRDELGNRWFANVLVPDGSVRMNRTIYLVEIRVTEVTSTPTPIDPLGGEE